MKLDERMGVLVAIGSAAAVNCHDCLRRLADRATALDVGTQEMAAAVKIGLRVNRAAGDKTEMFASNAMGGAEAHQPADRELAAVCGPGAGTSGKGCCAPSDERRG
jgi:hypothetical protein